VWSRAGRTCTTHGRAPGTGPGALESTPGLRGNASPVGVGHGGAEFPELAQRHVLSPFPSQTAKRFLAVTSATKSSILAVMSQLSGSQRWHRVLPGSGARLRSTRAGNSPCNRRLDSGRPGPGPSPDSYRPGDDRAPDASPGSTKTTVSPGVGGRNVGMNFLVL